MTGIVMGNTYNFFPIQSMFMKPGRMILVILIIFFCVISLGAAADDDCGCGDDSGWGEPGPNDGSWDSWSDDSPDSGSDSPDDSGMDTGNGADSGGGDQDGTGNDDSSTGEDSGSSSSSTDSEGSLSNGGGSAEEAVIWRMKGDDLYEKGLYNESLDAYETAIRLDPYALKSWTGKGRVLLALGIPSGAADAYGRAIRLDPGNAAAYIGLGDALVALEKYEEAVENYLKALAMNPRLPGVREKISGAEAVMAAALQTPDVTQEATPPATGEKVTEIVTQTVPTLSETPALSGTPRAGIPGSPVVILALLLSLVFLTVRKT